MRRGTLFLLIGLSASAPALADDGPHRLYDRETECAVFETRGFPADRAAWDGPCAHGLASGRGTATYFGKSGASETVSADFEDGAVTDGNADIAWSDGAHYLGQTHDGKPDGAGVLTDAAKNRFDGTWKDGSLNGHGAVAWANGDKYEGDWVAGKAEGHGTQTWADGQKYEGAWRADQPNGQGTLTRPDGTTVNGTFVDGKRQIATAAAPSPSAPSVSAPAPSQSGQVLDQVAGRTLMAVDGSTVTFAMHEGTLLRTTALSDGSTQKTGYVFLGKGLGTVTDGGEPPQVGGVFRTTEAGVVAEFSDGRVETMTTLGDGISISTTSGSGDRVCSSWFPQGHAFSDEERRAAVAAYARRLGVPDENSTHPSCGATAAATPAIERKSAPAPAVTPKRKPGHVALAMPPPSAAPADLDMVPVKISTVHLIDGAAPGSAPAPATDSAARGDEPVASNCLKVDSDGSYWGFRNHCGYAVQFAYCLLHGTNQMTACGNTGAVSVPGSVSANGFGALFGDDSLGERDVQHSFRWVGCKGGAGEVSAHLDSVEPISGHCTRAG